MQELRSRERTWICCYILDREFVYHNRLETQQDWHNIIEWVHWQENHPWLRYFYIYSLTWFFTYEIFIGNVQVDISAGSDGICLTYIIVSEM